MTKSGPKLTLHHSWILFQCSSLQHISSRISPIVRETQSTKQSVVEHQSCIAEVCFSLRFSRPCFPIHPFPWEKQTSRFSILFFHFLRDLWNCRSAQLSVPANICSCVTIEVLDEGKENWKFITHENLIKVGIVCSTSIRTLGTQDENEFPQEAAEAKSKTSMNSFIGSPHVLLLRGWVTCWGSFFVANENLQMGTIALQVAHQNFVEDHPR